MAEEYTPLTFTNQQRLQFLQDCNRAAFTLDNHILRSLAFYLRIVLADLERGREVSTEILDGILNSEAAVKRAGFELLKGGNNDKVASEEAGTHRRSDASRKKTAGKPPSSLHDKLNKSGR